MTSSENVKSLMLERDELDRKLQENRLVLEVNNCTMDSPLVDEEGFPIATIDVYAVRHARHNIICLENDRKALTDKLSDELEQLHEQDKQNSNMETNEEEAPVHRTSNTPFAKISSVTSGSPADLDGFKSGDLIIQYGNLHHGNFSDIKQVAEITNRNENKAIRVTVIRGGRPVRLEIRPRKWNGKGLLGCGIIPEKAESM